MKRSRKAALSLLSVLLVVVLALAVVGCGKAPESTPTTSPTASPTQTAQPMGPKVTLRLAHYFNKGDFRDRVMVKLAELTDKYSEGTVKVDVYPASQLAPAKDMLQSVGAGLADIGTATTSYTEGAVPETMIFGLSGDPRYTLRIMIDSFNEALDWINGKFSKSKVKVLTAIASPGGVYFFTKFPVTKLDDFNGKKIRIAGGALDYIGYSALGMKPVNIGAADQYTGLQTGVIDGCGTAPDSYLSYALYEVAPYATWVKYKIVPYPVFMNLDAWNRLTKQQQDALMKAAAETSKWSVDGAEKEEASVIAECAKKAKANYTPSDQDASAWLKKSAPVRTEWAKQVGPEAANYLLGILERRTGFKWLE